MENVGNCFAILEEECGIQKDTNAAIDEVYKFNELNKICGNPSNFKPR